MTCSFQPPCLVPPLFTFVLPPALHFLSLVPLHAQGSSKPQNNPNVAFHRYVLSNAHCHCPCEGPRIQRPSPPKRKKRNRAFSSPEPRQCSNPFTSTTSPSVSLCDLSHHPIILKVSIPNTGVSTNPSLGTPSCFLLR